MSGLRLRLRRPLEDRINLFGIVPDQLRDLSLEMIAALPVATEANEKRLSDWFDVCDGDRSILKFEGDLSRADYIGGGMRDGAIELTGSAGHFLAEGMRGGRIIVTGNASDYACSDMRGGSVVIEGSVGRCCAAARPAVRRGMRGGSVTICGHAGEQLCTRMRRGVVVLHGTAEGDVAAGMIAGSLILHSHVEGFIGAGMRRGTILVLGDRAPHRHAGFTAAEIVELSYRCWCVH
ncbi:MAG: formylmethanofuran dehydrogenase subunit C [Pirellulales bacterium]